MLFSADLGHYIGDVHVPLHLTRNNDDQYTNQTGVLRTYQTEMLEKYKDQISYSGNSVKYIDDVPDFVFNFIYQNYIFADSVLIFDREAAEFSGSTTDENYYSILWLSTKNFTFELLKNASYSLATLVYTAWTNAGSPTPDTPIHYESAPAASSFTLYQNFPNPFNPETMISFYLKKTIDIELSVYNIKGQLIEVIAASSHKAGMYNVAFNARNLESGLYIYQLKADNFISCKKMVLMR